MKTGVLDDETPVVRALTAVGVAVDELIMTIRDGGLDHHDAAELLIMLGQHASIGNRHDWVDAELIAAGRDRGMVEHTGQRSVAKVVESVCLVSPADANRRARAAEQTAGRTSPVGLPLPRLRDQVAEAMAAGAINAEQTAVVCRTLSKLDQAAVDPDQVAVVEAELVGHAVQYGPRDLSQLCRRYLDIYDPDGTEPNEQRNQERRFFTMRQTPTGATVGEFRLTGPTGARLAAVLEPLAKPRTTRPDETQPGQTWPDETCPGQTEHTSAGPDSAGPDSAGPDSAGPDGDGVDPSGVGGSNGTTSGLGVMTDPRTREQRLHDALDDACARLLRAGGLPDSGGTPAAVMINIDLNDLLHHTTGLTDPPAPRRSDQSTSDTGQPSGSTIDGPPDNAAGWSPGSAADWSPGSAADWSSSPEWSPGSAAGWSSGSAAGRSSDSEWSPSNAVSGRAAAWSSSPEVSPIAAHLVSSTTDFDDVSELMAPLTGMIMIKQVITNNIETEAPSAGTMITCPVITKPMTTKPATAGPAIAGPMAAQSVIVEAGETNQARPRCIQAMPSPQSGWPSESIASSLTMLNGITLNDTGLDDTGPVGAGKDCAGLDGSGLDGAGRNSAEQDGAGRDRSGPDKAGPEKAGLEKAGLEKAELDSEQGSTGSLLRDQGTTDPGAPSSGMPIPVRPDPATPYPYRPGRLGVGRLGMGRPRYGTTSRGQTISIPELLRLAGEAEIYPVVCTTSGQVLDLGRSRRIATKTQTMALLTRDGGCSFPGCDVPPEWCERHHVIGWEHNGPTDLDNLTLLCSFHHRHFLQRGWHVTMDNGIPEWIPPRWLDPKQRPRINHRITAQIHQQSLLTDHGS